MILAESILEVKAVRSSPQADNTKATGSIAFLELGKVIVGISKKASSFLGCALFSFEDEKFRKRSCFFVVTNLKEPPIGYREHVKLAIEVSQARKKSGTDKATFSEEPQR